MNIQHSSRTDLWYTPLDIILRVRQVLGPIDLDPASDEFGNARVGARYFFTRETDGLENPWPKVTSVFLNPPGGKRGRHSLSALFWKKLMQSRADYDHAIFMGFSLEQMQTTQGKGVPSILEFPFCVPAKRLAFDSPLGVAGAAPSHSNVIVYVPGTTDRSALFQQSFKDIGAVRL